MPHHVDEDAPILLLQLGPWLHEALVGALGPRYRVLAAWEPDAFDRCMARHGPAIRGIITHTLAIPTDEAQLQRLPALELVINLGSGRDSLDAEALARRGIPVRSGAGANADDVAELAICLMLAVGRGMVEGDRLVRAGQWSKDHLPARHRVSGKALGIFGMGHIGQAIARRALAFDMRIAYCSRHPQPALPYRHESSLEALARDSDILIAAVPGGPATRHSIDARVLAALGPEGMLVNIARGSVVDEAALVHALRNGLIGGAGLDVFEHEPAVPAALRAHPRVVLQPHLGGVTVEAYRDIAALAARNLDDHFG